MKTTIATLFLLCISAISLAQNVHIPDTNFLNALIEENVDKNNDRKIQKLEAEAITHAINVNNKNISDLTGIEAFVNLNNLYCSNNNLTNLDVSQLKKLRELACYNNSLTSLNVNDLSSLSRLFCENNNLSTLNLIGLSNLITLICEHNQLINIDISELSSLNTLQCGNNSLTQINANGLSDLYAIVCDSNNISSLSLVGTNLGWLHCNNNQLSSLNLTKSPYLMEVKCQNNFLNVLDVSELNDLELLICQANNLPYVCVAQNHNTSSWKKDPSTEWSTDCKPLASSEIESTEKAQILKAYNLQGKEVPVSTKGEVIILLYDNGTREKTYIAQ